MSAPAGKKGKGKTSNQGKKRFYGEYECPECGHTWNSGKSRANKAQQCNNCKIKVFPHIEDCETSAPAGKTGEGKTPYQGKKRCYGEFECPECGHTWSSSNSWANEGQLCNICKINVFPHIQDILKKGKGKTPYQGQMRCFGEYECPECGQTWKSGSSWANMGQQCNSCEINVYPHRQLPLEKVKGAPNNRIHHPQNLCEKCKELGHNCRHKYRR